MNSAQTTNNQHTDHQPRWQLPWPGGSLTLLLGLLVAGFFLSPWTLEEKARAALHGLCAQIPSHTFLMGNQPLPFDARMTGIYGGFFVSFLWLAIRTRGFRFGGVPKIGIIITLTAFVAIMGIDGTNSLLLDLRLPNLYEPHNNLRLVTGALTGVSLAVMVSYLLAVTLWADADYGRPVIRSHRDAVGLVALTIPYLALVFSGAAWLYVPITLLLLVSAVLVVSSLALVLVLLATKRDCRYTQFAQAEGMATVAVILGVGAMAAIAGGRFWLEAVTGANLML